ncbi:MAG: hypothetical protein ABGX83_07855 [Nitrospira sp.]
MKKTFWHRAIYWTVLLAFGFMADGKGGGLSLPFRDGDGPGKCDGLLRGLLPHGNDA